MAARVATTRTERAIVRTRVALAAAGCLVVWLGQADAVPQPLVGYVLLGAYLTYAAGLAVLVRSAHTMSAWWPSATQAVDALACTAWLYADATHDGPVLVFFVFLLVTATLRWSSTGALAVGGSVLLALALLVIGLDADLDWHVFLSHIVLLSVVTGLVAHLGAVHERHSRQLEALARWPTTIPAERPALARDVVASAVRIVRAPRLLLVWEEQEEPWVDVAFWDGGRFSWRQEPPGAFDGMVAPALQHCSFVCYRASDPRAKVFSFDGGAVSTLRGAPLSPALRDRYRVTIVASCPVRGGTVDGRLFFFDNPDLSTEDLIVGETLAALIATRLSHAQLLNEVRQDATLENRVKLARDLHDGVLQALTGAALQVQAARRLLATNTPAAAARLDELQQILAAEHAEIRSFINDLQPPEEAARGEVGLAGQLGALASRVRRQWAVEVQVAIEPDPLLVPDTIAPDLYFLVHEAVVNAARHSGARRISVAILQTIDRLSMAVADDGQGFPFEGRYSGTDLATRGLGPSSLRERVASLGGQLVVESSRSGARVEIELPIAARVL